MRPLPLPWRRATWVCAILSTASVTGLARQRELPVTGSPDHRFAADSIDLDSSYAFHSCAPNDGPAVTLYLGGTLIKSAGHMLHVEPPYVGITVWEGWPTLEGRTFTLQSYHGGGAASYCSARGTCNRLDPVQISFERVTDDRLRGTVRLTLDRRPIVREFSARLLPIRLLCG